MLRKIKYMSKYILLTILVVTLIGCAADDEEIEDLEPPAIPRGVITITGDNSVRIEWYPNGEYDLDGYTVWRSEDNIDFDALSDISVGTSEYTDNDVRNGRTYYYAVSAYDFNGNESELSPENAWDTPRPEGRNISLEDYQLAPERSGFDFSHPQKGSSAWDDRATDIYFALDTEVNITYFFSDNGTAMQDLGYHEHFDDVDTVPEYGYITLLVEAIEGHIYAFYTPDGNFAKVHVRKLFDDSITFDWAYQTDPENIQLAPKLTE
ncbi:fibronectin type III domain-containing protein [Candidatus Poribacteria bacterium]|nr:fibronectin type III domain-containing protein [Candidatus Poribacteria bacterium]